MHTRVFSNVSFGKLISINVMLVQTHVDARAGTYSGMLGQVCPDTFTSSDLHGGK